MSKSVLKAGVAKVNITPPVGMPQAGFFARFANKQVSQGVLDDLYSKALVLSDGKQIFLLIANDLVDVSLDITSRVRSLVAQKTGIPAENVLVCASHTHSGPTLIGPYVDVLVQKMAGAVYVAWKDMKEATIGAGRGRVEGVTVNRRKPYAPVDTEVGVVKVDDKKGEPISLLVNFSCHGVVLGPSNLLISGDYPGYLTRFMEEASCERMIALFTRGSGGNVNPITSEGYMCKGTLKDVEKSVR